MIQDTPIDPSLFKDGKYQTEYQNGQQSEKQDEKFFKSRTVSTFHKESESDDFEIQSARKWIKEKTYSQPDIAAAVNPAHYKCHLPASDVPYQWAQTQWFKARKSAEKLKKALASGGLVFTTSDIDLMQRSFYVEVMRVHADKYHARFGLKDVDVQELQKTQWYLKAAELAYTGPFHSNGMPYLPDEV